MPPKFFFFGHAKSWGCGLYTGAVYTPLLTVHKILENSIFLRKLVKVCPSYQAILELTLFYIYSERNWGKSNILIAEILNFCHFCVQNEWKIVRRWHHQLVHLHIHTDWSRSVSWKFAKLQSVITSLFLNRFSSGFHYLIHKFLLFLLKLSLNLFRISPLITLIKNLWFVLKLLKQHNYVGWQTSKFFKNQTHYDNYATIERAILNN